MAAQHCRQAASRRTTQSLAPKGAFYGGIGMWLAVSWVGIPAFFLVAGLLVNHHSLLFGLAIAMGIYAFRRR